ncbi:MAG: hypothetical protein JXQ82_10185 [Methanomicrobiaceae archaeon]|nr:hypothetical protein [Methanomicrobiaceae archaeon]
MIFAAAALILASGCMMTDAATGEWEKESLLTQDKLTINPDGTFFISDVTGYEINSGTWNKKDGKYEFIFKNSERKEYAEISQGRAEFYMIFDNATYSKI